MRAATCSSRTRGRRDHGHEHPRVFGGLVLGQAALAAGRTAPDPTLHSLHAYFLRGGRNGVSIEYAVERVRDGRTFTARRVLARQEGKPICDITMSFVHPEEGISHQEPMPDAPDPGNAARFMGSVAGRAGRAALAEGSHRVALRRSAGLRRETRRVDEADDVDADEGAAAG